MTYVSNQEELQKALSAGESSIQVIDDFKISSQITVRHTVAISGPETGSSFTISRDSSYHGYLIRISDGGALMLQNTILDGDKANHPMNNAANRSLILLAGGSLTLETGAVLQDNNSYLEGGGVYLSGNKAYTNNFVMQGNAKITNCHSNTNGGGIMAALRNENDRATIREQAVLSENSAANGGGIYHRPYEENVSASLAIGGGVRITGNTASAIGGGICFFGYRGGKSSPSTLTLTESVVVSENVSVHGGGVYCYCANDGDRMALSAGVTISQNTASHNGGGICMTATTGSADFMIQNASITGNTGGTGGGIYLLTDAGGAFNILNSDIRDNSAINGASGTGGGIWMQNRTADRPMITAISGSFISSNNASADGGGAALFMGPGNTSVRITESTFIKNTAASEGGGILASSAGSCLFDLIKPVLKSNTAGGSGGGMYYANTGDETTSTKLSFTSANAFDNKAGFEGGGLRLSSGRGTLDTSLYDCIVSSNTASRNSGGGIWNGGVHDSLKLQGATIVSDNVSEEGNGGGIYFNSDYGSLILKDNVKINGNHADGRISMTGNHGGGICAVPGKISLEGNAEIYGNQALKYGGGLSASESSAISLSSGSIHGNISSMQGGGVWLHGNSTLTQTGGSISQNQADYGGGIYNSLESSVILAGGVIDGNKASIGGGIYNTANSTATLSGMSLFGKPTPNTASDFAPGIYNAGLLYVKGMQSIGNGVYLNSRNAAVYLRGPLENISDIQLDASDYVYPDPDDAPIIIGRATPSYPILAQADADAFHKPPSGFDQWYIRLSDDYTQIVLTLDLFYYTVTYQGNDRCCNKAENIPVPSIVQNGGRLTIPGQIPVRKGFRFLGWNTESCGKGSNYMPGSVIPAVTKDMTLYAQWKKICWRFWR